MNKGYKILIFTVFCFFSIAGFAADNFAGKKIYKKHCVKCHGIRGVGKMPAMPDFSKVNTLLKPDDEILGILKKGQGMMPGYLGVLNEIEILDVLAYLRTLHQ